MKINMSEVFNRKNIEFDNFDSCLLCFSKNAINFNKIIYISKNFTEIRPDAPKLVDKNLDLIFPRFLLDELSESILKTKMI